MALIVITLQDGDGELGQGVQVNIQIEGDDGGQSLAQQLGRVALEAIRNAANAANSSNN